MRFQKNNAITDTVKFLTQLEKRNLLLVIIHYMIYSLSIQNRFRKSFIF